MASAQLAHWLAHRTKKSLKLKYTGKTGMKNG